jgi:hypothetical protein
MMPVTAMTILIDCCVVMATPSVLDIQAEIAFAPTFDPAQVANP